MKPWIAVACMLLVSEGVHADAAATILREPDRVRLADPPHRLADFTLTDQHGRALKFSALRGRTALVFFGFTHCRNVCPTILQSLRKLRRAMQDDAPPVVVMISVDGERDTPAEMSAYLEPFGSGFVGLTGPPLDVRTVANRFSAVFFNGMPTDTSGGYDVEHTSQVYLVDREGYLRATFYNAPQEDIAAVSRDIQGRRR